MIDWDSEVLGPLNSVFGESFVYTPAGGLPVVSQGIYDEAYTDISLVADMGVQTTRPVLGVQLSLLPVMPMQGDTVSITRLGEIFAVLEVRPDGHGWAKLLLNEGM